MTRRGMLALVAGAAAGVPAVTPALAADPWVCRTTREVRLQILLLQLTPQQQEAFLRMGHRLVAGMPVRLAGYRMHRELGATAREARDRVDAALAGGRAAA